MALGVNIVSSFDSKGISKAIRDFNKLEGAGNKATFGLRTLDKAAVNGLKSIARAGAAIGAVAGVIGFKLVSAAYESQKVMKQTEAIIKSTGGAAGVTAIQVGKLSEKLSMQIGVDDELIQKSANLLLTFKQVQNQTGLNNNIFDQAVIAAQDLGNVFGSADAAAMQLGKALSDPIAGISALRRAGINFTDQQKAQIKTLVESGDILGAQKIILKEVESQVGGTAAASATGFDRMRVALGNVAEKFGALLIPYVEQFANFVINTVVPYLNTLADVLGEQGVGGAVKMLGTDFIQATTNMGAFGDTVLVITAAFVTLRLVAMAATIAMNLFNVALFSNPIGIAVAAVIALAVALVALYLKFEIVRKVINTLGQVLKTAFMNVIEAIYNAFALLYNAVASSINYLIKAANLFGANIPEIEMLGFKAFTVIGSAANKAAGSIGVATDRMAEFSGKMPKDTTFVPPISTGVTKTIETATQKLQKYVDALKGLTSAQRAYRDAGKAALKSDQDLLTAKDKLITAQTNFNNVLNGFGKDSVQAKDAQSELTKAQRDVEQAGYDVEAALFAVANAQQAVTDSYLDPNRTPQTIREAEIALAKAKLGVVDATDAQGVAVKNLATKQTLLDEAINGAATSSDTFKDAAKELKDAQDALVDATDAQTAAYEREKDALDALNESTKKAITLKGGVVPKDAAAAEAAAGVTPTAAGAGMYGSFMQAVRALHPNAASLKSNTPIKDSRLAFPKLYKTYKDAGLAMAKGGIVTSPTQILAGESGAEAIIPLDKLQSGTNINITVNAGMGSDGTQIGKMIVNELQAYQRRVGSLPLKVSA
jgi:hypothetical protein